MKRFLCALFVSMMIAPAALATDFSDFNMCSAIFGAHEFNESDGDARNNYIRFIQDECTITFRIDDGEIGLVMIDGSGDAFLAYSMSAIMQFDPETNNAVENGGQLLLYYLMCKADNGKREGKTVSGSYYQIEKKDEGYTFIISK